MELEDMYPLHARVHIKKYGVGGVIYERRAAREGWYGVRLDRTLHIVGMATSVLHVSHDELTVVVEGNVRRDNIYRGNIHRGNVRR